MFLHLSAIWWKNTKKYDAEGLCQSCDVCNLQVPMQLLNNCVFLEILLLQPLQDSETFPFHTICHRLSSSCQTWSLKRNARASFQYIWQGAAWLHMNRTCHSTKWTWTSYVGQIAHNVVCIMRTQLPFILKAGVWKVLLGGAQKAEIQQKGSNQWVSNCSVSVKFVQMLMCFPNSFSSLSKTSVIKTDGITNDLTCMSPYWIKSGLAVPVSKVKTETVQSPTLIPWYSPRLY